MALLDLDPDQLLSTTRAVRKRLDFARPVPEHLIRECVAMALQAPSGPGRGDPLGRLVTARGGASSGPGKGNPRYCS